MLRAAIPLQFGSFVLLALAATETSHAQTFGPDFAADYSFVDLGGPPGVPTPLGGVNFKLGDLNTLLIGGAANSTSGAIYELPVTRDAQGHIVGYVGGSSLFSTAPNIDGGLAYGPGDVLFFTEFPLNKVGQIKVGSTSPDREDDLTGPGVCSSLGALTFVPPGFPGAGRLKLASFDCNQWYDAQVTSDGVGTFDIINITNTGAVTGGPEGMVYIDAANPGFTVDSILLAEWSAGQVGAYDIDANGDPVLSTRRDFMLGLSGAEGAVIDPLTGDFIFSTFGGGDRILVVTGFDAPTVYCSGKTNSLGCVPTIGATGSPTLTGADDFVVSSLNNVNGTFGILMWGTAPANNPMWGGTLCITSQSLVFPVLKSGGSGAPTGFDCSGAFSLPLTQSWLAGTGLSPGDPLFVQFIGRDPGFPTPNAIALSDALTFTIKP